LRNRQTQIIQDVIALGAVVTETQISDFDVSGFG